MLEILQKTLPILLSVGKFAAMQAIEFYKTWDQYGSLTNFSPHPIMMPISLANANGLTQKLDGPLRKWQTLEHYYQAQKFAGDPLDILSLTTLVMTLSLHHNCARSANSRTFCILQPKRLRFKGMSLQDSSNSVEPLLKNFLCFSELHRGEKEGGWGVGWGGVGHSV